MEIIFWDYLVSNKECTRWHNSWNKLKIPDCKNAAKQNRYEFPSASSIIKCLEDFDKITGFHESFCPFFSKHLHIYFNPAQNAFPILLPNGLVMVTNEGWTVCNCFKKEM